MYLIKLKRKISKVVAVFSNNKLKLGNSSKPKILLIPNLKNTEIFDGKNIKNEIKMVIIDDFRQEYEKNIHISVDIMVSIGDHQMNEKVNKMKNNILHLKK